MENANENPGAAGTAAGADPKRSDYADHAGHGAAAQGIGSRFGTYRWRERPAYTPRQEVVAGLLAPGEVALLTGAPGSGKSTLAVALARAVLTGAPFLGRATRAGAVAYLAAERGRSIARRLIAAEVPDDAPLAILPKSFQLVEDLDAVVSEIRSALGWPRLIIVDTLARTIPGIEENSAREMGPVAEALGRLAEAFEGAAVVAVHHTSKDGSAIRGSSALLGAVDLDLRVETRKASRAVRVAKANEVAENQTLPFTLEVVELEDNTTTTRAVEAGLPTAKAGGVAAANARRRDESSERALAALDHLPPRFSIAEAADALHQSGAVEGSSPGSRKVTTRRMIEKLVALGRVQDLGGGAFAVAEQAETDGNRL